MSADHEQELHPHAVIVANDASRFAIFASFLEKNGYPCRSVQALPSEEARPGSVYFVSFNLHSESALAAAKRIESTAGLVCIVFAEEPGVATAAKLSSAKMSQTLQHPYTEKNFLMALQTIVKNRKAQFEKDERKRHHDERLKARQQSAVAAKDHGVIIQHAPEAITDSETQVFKTAAPAGDFSETQLGPRANSFFIIQEGAAAPGPSKIGAHSSAASGKTKLTVVDQARAGIVSGKEENHSARAESFITTVRTALFEKKKDAPAIKLTVPIATERPMSHFWAVLGVCLFGSAICLYCVYEILTL